jgi:hypothetical protein
VETLFEPLRAMMVELSRKRLSRALGKSAWYYDRYIGLMKKVCRRVEANLLQIIPATCRY